MSNTISRLFFLTCLTLGMASCQESDRGLDVLARGASPSTHSAPPAPSRSPALTDPIPWNPSLPIPFGVLPQNSQRFDVTQLGVQYLRFELDWSLLQPNCLGGQQPPDCDPEPIDWTAQDAFMDDIEALGLRAFPSIYVGRAQWINGKDPYTHGLVEPQSFPPKDLSDEWAEEYGYSLIYYNFLTELFERYRGRLDYVALENEATNLIYWGGGSCDYPGDPDCDYLAAAQEYVRLVKTAAKAINDTRHDGDPPIRTMDSGIVSGHWGFVIAKEGIDLGLDPPTGYTDWYTWAWDYYTLGIPESSVPEWHSLEELTEALDTPAEDLEVWIETTEILDGLYYDPTREPGQSGPAVHLLNFHYYESYRWIPRVADWIRDRALQTQALAMPVMSNEMGMRGSYDPDQCIPNYFDDVELDRQSREVFKNLAMTRVSDLQGLVWYSIDTTCEEDRTEPDKASLMNYPDSTPRPSGSTFERSVRVLNQDGLTFVETVSAGPQLFQYHYRIGSALDPWPVDLVVAWTEPTDPDGECPPPCVLPITLGSILANPTAVVTDYKGDITHLPVSNNQVTVDISDPVFIRLGYPPASPSALSATPISSSQIDLMWQDTSSGETAFIVERKQDPGPFAEIIELPPDTTAYPDLSRAPSTPYCYRVRASRNGVDSVHSAEACATTLAVYTITATKDGEGDGWVASDPPGLACGDVCSYDFSSGTAVVVTAEPDASSAFDTWGGACASVPRTDPCVLVVDSSKSVQATFKAGFLLSVSAQGGTLAGSPPGILCGTGGVDCSERYVVDTEVQLTATPDDAYGLKAWGGDCASTPPTSSTCDLTISDNLNAWAEFVPKYVLNVGDSDPNDLGGGRVHTVDAFGGHVEGIDCTLGGSGQGDCTQEYLDGSFVYLVAESETGSIFGGWADACAGSGEETGCALVLAGDTAVNATFKLLYHLSVSLEGTGVGRVDIASEGETVTCGPTCALDLPEGTQVTLTATPALNHTFDGWGGDCASEPGVVCDIAMSGARTATATFTPLYTLSVGVGGPGNIKTVDANGVPIDGIHCGTTGGTCWKEYRSGSPVYLKAFPDGHALFSDWAVDCDLTVGDTCTLLMTRDMTANASFKPLHTLAVNPQTQGWNGAGNVLGYYADRTPTGLDCGNGGLVCAMEFPEGTEVALVATPASGSMFSNWSGGCTVNWDGSCTATLSAPTAVDATFKLVFTMTVTQDGDGSGTVSPQPTPLTSVCDQAQCLIEYPELEAVTLTATANPGSLFDTWTGPCGGSLTDPQCSFNLEGDTTVTASFIPQWHLTVSVETPYGGAGRVYTVDTAGVEIDGIDCGGQGLDCDEQVLDGSLVRLKAAPNDGSGISDWTGICSSTVGDVCEFTVSGPQSAGAGFAPLYTVLTEPQTGTWRGRGNVVTIDPDSGDTVPGIDCGPIPPVHPPTGGMGMPAQAGSPETDLLFKRLYGPDCAEPFVHGTQVVLKGIPEAGSVFTEWGDGIDDPCTGTGDTCGFVVDGTKTVEATFKLVFTLTVTQDGDGSGTVSPQPTPLTSVCDQAQCLIEYPELEAVTLTATANPGSLFDTWTGPCGGSLTDPQCSFNLEGDTTVTASFIPQWHLTVSVETPYGGAGSVHTIDDPTTGNRIPGIDCSGSGPDCEELFRDQTLVHLKAEPAPGSIFYAWGGACLGVTTDVCSLEMASDIEAVAAFRPLLTLTITPQTFGWNGSGQVLAYDETGQNVILECLSISPSCSVSYPYGLTAKVEAVPDLSSLFSGWAGACSGTGRTCWVTMEVNESVEATFKLIYTLTLTKAGTGRGTVTSNDPGLKINCGRGCLSDQGTYGEGEAVLLTAAPDSSSIFSGWSENCAVSGQNGEVCTVTMSGAETTIAVTSEFNRARLAPGNQVRGAKRRASAPPK